jgi:hypothetical protein
MLKDVFKCLLSCLAYSQIWLNIPMNDPHQLHHKIDQKNIAAEFQCFFFCLTNFIGLFDQKFLLVFLTKSFCCRGGSNMSGFSGARGSHEGGW